MSDCTLGDPDRLTPENPAPYRRRMSMEFSGIDRETYGLIIGVDPGALDDHVSYMVSSNGFLKVVHPLTIAERDGRLLFDRSNMTPIFDGLADEYNHRFWMRLFAGSIRGPE